MMRILIAEPDHFSPLAIRTLQRMGSVECKRLRQRKIPDALRTYDVVWIRLGLHVRANDLPPEPRCAVVVTATTGIDHVDASALSESGIRLVSLRGHARFLKTITATAELTIGLLLSLVRQIPGALKSVRDGEWNRDRFRGRELKGKVAGVVGFGRLGSRVSSFLRAMGMQVIAYDPHVSRISPGVRRASSLHTLLARADVVTVHVNLESSNIGLFDQAAFTAMKPGSWFINTSRGALVDEPALLQALRSGHLAGAAVDVVSGEPGITRDHPLVRYARANRNLLITPHIGGATADSMAACEEYLAGYLIREFGFGRSRRSVK